MDYLGGNTIPAALAGAAAIATLIYISTRRRYTVLPPTIDLNEQSKEISRSELSRQSLLVPEGEYLTYLYADAQTLYECMLRGSRVSSGKLCLGARKNNESDEYEWLKYDQVLRKTKCLGAGLIQMGLKAGSYVGIYSKNCVEYVLMEYACYSQSMVVVPLYDTLGPYACTLVINEADIDLVICDSEGKVTALLDDARRTPKLKTIVVIREVDESLVKRAESDGILVMKFSELEDLGKMNPCETNLPSPETLAVVCYTSGTSGDPKGVMLTHKNIVANVSAVTKQLGEYAPQKEDIMLSFLPLAHMFERCCQVCMYMVGGRIGFYCGDIRRLSEDFKALKPTVTPMVPVLLNRAYQKVQELVSTSKLKSALLSKAVNSRKSGLEAHHVRPDNMCEWLAFRTIRRNFGGNLRLIMLGSAPMDGKVLTFFRCALGGVIVEGYGQTECVGPCTVTIPRDPYPCHVGPPLTCCRVKLVDVPDMNYCAAEGSGEICVKGPTVFKGYLKDPGKTAATITEDGWLRTGDIGTWQPNGTLKILDRKNNIFKLAQGEFVVPEKIENIYGALPMVYQVFVHGESIKSNLVGIVVPEEKQLSRWAREHSIPGSLQELCADDRVKTKILNDLVAVGKQSGLKSFEQVKDVHLTPRPFTVDNNLVTPTMKIRRKNCKEFFQREIESMYSRLA